MIILVLDSEREEWVQVCIWGLHADKDLVVYVFLALYVLHLEEAIEDATKSLNLVDFLHTVHFFFILTLLGECLTSDQIGKRLSLMLIITFSVV